LILLGYNTPSLHPGHPELDALSDFHNELSLQSGAYQNGAWVVAVAKAGTEEGVTQIGGTCIVAPSGKIVAQAKSLDDELIVHRCDLDATRVYKEQIFHFGRNRRVEHYGPIVEQTEAELPND
jgi:predicted amidohydrolase